MAYRKEVASLEDANPAFIRRNAAQFRRLHRLVESADDAFRKATKGESGSDARDGGGERHHKSGKHTAKKLSEVIARESDATTPTWRTAESLGQWEDSRATTGVLDFRAELTVDVGAIREDAENFYNQTRDHFGGAFGVESYLAEPAGPWNRESVAHSNVAAGSALALAAVIGVLTWVFVKAEWLRGWWFTLPVLPAIAVILPLTLLTPELRRSGHIDGGSSAWTARRRGGARWNGKRGRPQGAEQHDPRLCHPA